MFMLPKKILDIYNNYKQNAMYYRIFASCLYVSRKVFSLFTNYFSRLLTKPTKWLVCPVKTQISLAIRPVWSGSLLSSWRNIASSATHWAHCQDWSDWVDAQADLSLCWAHMSFCWFCHEEAHFYFYRSHTEAGWGDCRPEVKNVRGHGPYAQWLDGHYVSVKVGKFIALAAFLDGTVKWSDDRQVKSEPSRLWLHPQTDVGWFPASNSPNLLLCWFCQLN